nr:putative serine carboxypeptidase-like 23 [Ipomoea batatas]
MATLLGFGHGLNRIDQARRIMWLRRAKMQVHHGIPVETDEPLSDEEMVSSFSDVGSMEDDLIQGGLPGQPSNVKFNQYAGYVNVDKTNGRSLFYYFAESAQSPDTKPLILWLNGGPGCSSLGVGAFVELGPFGVNPDGKTLYSRRFAWNKVANTLFLESPAGVGFSYSNTSSDYDKSGDRRTAADAYKFLVNWFKKFPHYKTRDFYIIGESYAGYYIPELADVIVKRNMMPETTLKIPLKGIMIGNGIMNDDTDVRGGYDYLWSHALISDETHRGLIEHCVVNFSIKCEHFERAAGMEIGSIDFYNIYGPLCLDSESSRKVKRRLGFDPCEEDYVYSYLNLPKVQKALHANNTKLPYTWEVCSEVITYWKDRASTMFPIYRRLIASGQKILLFSGDVDSVVPVTSTRYSVNAMKLKVIKPWHPWEDGNKEVGGYKVVYEGLTFATVRGAGHEVPQFKPRSALALLNMFLATNHH